MLTLPGPANDLNIGLLGGSFNPAHDGHMHVAETAMRALHLDWVWWLPARGNPLKIDQTPFAKRFVSAAALAGPHPRMHVSDFEVQAGLTYSVDTIAALKARAPGARFVWLMGGDSLANFHLWKDWQMIARQVPIAVIARPGSQRAALGAPFVGRFSRARISVADAARLPFLQPPAWTYLPAPLNALSSTKIRSDRSR